MTYTKKKIVVEVDVPDGATHYGTLINVDGDTCIDWFKQVGDCVYLWDGVFRKWVAAFTAEYLEMKKTIKPIEVIE